jgi:hypothetical protein
MIHALYTMEFDDENFRFLADDFAVECAAVRLCRS